MRLPNALPSALFAALLALVAAPLQANEARAIAGGDSARLLSAPQATSDRLLASYGPFHVVARDRAVMTGITDEHSPARFAAMLRDFPSLATLEMIDCPGTEHDRANLQLGRMIRAAGLRTVVPAGGSVRSGAVELFLAGAIRQIDDGARFAVHAWMDEDGREAQDYPVNAPENRKYITYYREMGMGGATAASFYAMTNSVPHTSAKWLDAREMRRWLGQGAETAEATQQPAPRLAYLDLNAALHYPRGP